MRKIYIKKSIDIQINNELLNIISYTNNEMKETKRLWKGKCRSF